MVARSVAPRVALRKARWFLERLVKERPQRRKALIVKFCNRLQLDESGRSYCLSLLTADAVTPAQQARNAVYQEPRRLYQHHLETLPPPQLTGEELQALVSIEHAMVWRLKGCLVRLRMPWFSEDCEYYSAATIIRIDCPRHAPSVNRSDPILLTVRPLDDNVRSVLGNEWVTTCGYISNDPLNPSELACAKSLPNVAAAPIIDWQLIGDRLSARIQLSRKEPCCTALEAMWWQLRDGEPEAERQLVAGSIGGGPALWAPGIRSYGEWLGATLGGENTERTKHFMQSGSAAERLERVEKMMLVFEGRSMAERQRARQLGYWLYIEQYPDFDAHFEYLDELRRSGSAKNFERDDAADMTAHGTFAQYAVSWKKLFKKARVQIQDAFAADRRCCVCFESSRRVIADGGEWVLLRPCRHATCGPCADKLLDRGNVDCPMRCGKVLTWEAARMGGA